MSGVESWDGYRNSRLKLNLDTNFEELAPVRGWNSEFEKQISLYALLLFSFAWLYATILELVEQMSKAYQIAK